MTTDSERLARIDERTSAILQRLGKHSDRFEKVEARAQEQSQRITLAVRTSEQRDSSIVRRVNERFDAIDDTLLAWRIHMRWVVGIASCVSAILSAILVAVLSWYLQGVPHHAYPGSAPTAETSPAGRPGARDLLRVQGHADAR